MLTRSRFAALLDPDAEWEDIDPIDPLRRLADQLRRAREARRAEASAQAELWSACAAVLAEAWAHPELWLSAFRGTDAERADFAVRSAVADLAVRLRLAEGTVRDLAARAELLREHLPLVWAGFRIGRIPTTNAAAAASLASSLPADARSVFDEALAGPAAELAPARFRARARRLRERLHPLEAAARHREAADARRVWIEGDLDGMCWLTAHLPTDVGTRIMARLDSAARHLLTADGDERTLDQARADVASDLLLSARADAPGVTATVAVTVPVLTLLGASDEPGSLDGVVPIPADEARRLAGGAASWQRILTHPVSGTVLDVDRTSYRPPADLARWVRQRHPTCYFPGCPRRAEDCDLDHVVAWEDGGDTSAANLRPACPPHHRLKHEGGWTVELRPDGGARWTSPTGEVIDEDPPPF